MLKKHLDLAEYIIKCFDMWGLSGEFVYMSKIVGDETKRAGPDAHGSSGSAADASDIPQHIIDIVTEESSGAPGETAAGFGATVFGGPDGSSNQSGNQRGQGGDSVINSGCALQ